MNSKTKHLQCASLICATLLIASPVASADAVCDWNLRAGEIVVSGRMGPPPANRAMAITNTAVYEAVNAITKRYPAGVVKLEAAPGASSRRRNRGCQPHGPLETASLSAERN